MRTTIVNIVFKVNQKRRFNMETITKVRFIYRKKEIIALFPEIIADNTGNILSYAHLGQHGAASKSLMRCKKANKLQYKNLKKELTNIGYKLKLV